MLPIRGCSLWGCGPGSNRLWPGPRRCAEHAACASNGLCALRCNGVYSVCIPLQAHEPLRLTQTCLFHWGHGSRGCRHCWPGHWGRCSTCCLAGRSSSRLLLDVAPLSLGIETAGGMMQARLRTTAVLRLLQPFCQVSGHVFCHVRATCPGCPLDLICASFDSHWDRYGEHGSDCCEVLIERNSTVPTSKSQDFTTFEDYQAGCSSEASYLFLSW